MEKKVVCPVCHCELTLKNSGFDEMLSRQREEFARELRGLHTKQAENLHRAIADLLEKWEVVR